MTPIHEIIAGQADVTAVMRDRLISVTLTDEAGYQSDTLEIRLDDRGSRIALPRRGVTLSIRLGFLETGLATMGDFIVDEVELEGLPSTLIVRARSADLRDELKDQKTRSWSDTTLREVVAAVAADHGLDLRMPPPPPTIHLAHLDQSNESDLHLLTRLARRWDYTLKISGKRLAFVPAGRGLSASGEQVSDVTIRPDQVKEYRATLSDRGKYRSVEAHWQDQEEGEQVTERAGKGEPVFVLRHTYADAEQAKAAAQARLDQLARGRSTVSLTLSRGEPRLRAQSRVTLEGFRSGINGEWVAQRVEHEYGSSGYSTSLEGEVPAA
ncbi:MAG: contractile injection system protein, VgrG/Pvc8 family [Acidobacteriota bacterium]|nr:contractile injection system protein, VgrG/Pvc8 family [Acidobacteriota bacterium]